MIAVTSAVDFLIEPEDLKAGAIVCDVARPRNVSREVASKRKDVLVIEGGVTRCRAMSISISILASRRRLLLPVWQKQ